MPLSTRMGSNFLLLGCSALFWLGFKSLWLEGLFQSVVGLLSHPIEAKNKANIQINRRDCVPLTHIPKAQVRVAEILSPQRCELFSIGVGIATNNITL